MNPRSTPVRTPLFFAALAFAVGVCASVRMWRPPLWWFIALLVFAAGTLYWRRRRPRMAFALALASVGALGAFAVQARDAGTRLPDLSRFAEGPETVVTGHVIRDGLLRRGAFGEQRESLDLETEAITLDGVTTPICAGLRVTIYSRDNAEEDDTDTPAPQPPTTATAHSYGQRLRFAAKLRLPRNYGNPGALDYRGYLARQGVLAMASVRADRVELLPGSVGGRLGVWQSRLRRSVLARIHALWPEQGPGLMDAMLIGERAYIGHDTSVSFQRTGAYHILVVSGMNLGILAFVVFWVLRRIRLGEIAASVVTILLSIGYAYLCDLGAPILRAALMLAVYLGSRLLYRERSPLNSVGTAALALLVIDPSALFDTSFQLTFLAVMAIAAIGIPLLERTSAPLRRALRNLDSTGYDLALAPRLVQFRLDLRMLIERLSRFFGVTIARWLLTRTTGALLATWDVLVISALMQIAMALPMAAYFHRATILALPVNALVVPATGVLMPAASLAVALAYIWTPLARVPALIAGWSLDVITGTVRILGGLRLADVRVSAPQLAVAMCAVCAFAFAMWAVRKRPLLAGAGLAGLLAAALWITLAPARPLIRPGVLELTAIDVGQADSTLIISPHGRALLVDAAGAPGAWRSEFDFGEDVISPYLWSRRITRLDAVALTHAHADHIGGMRAVVANFRPRELWLGPTPETPALRLLLEEAARQGTEVVRHAAGDRVAFGGAQVRVLSPPADWLVAAKPRNNDSLVMEISYGSTAALLEGDAERRMEREFLAAEPHADLLKVAHNGSASSTVPELLAALHPKFAVISVGAHNSFSHPRAEVLSRLAAGQVATFRTDTMGAVTFYLDGSSITTKPEALRLR